MNHKTNTWVSISRLRRTLSTASDERGTVIVAAIIILATLTGITAASLLRSSNTLKATKSVRNQTTTNYDMRSVINLVLQDLKDYSWTSGQDLDDLLPSGGNRFETWYSSSYNGISYTVEVGDNSEASEGTQNYNVDTDNTAYLRIAMTAGGETTTVQALVSPGAEASPGTDPPGDLPASVGICYGWLNLLTLLSLASTDTTSGFDMTPEGMYGCPAGGGDCTGSNDQYGISTTSWFGSWEVGSFFGTNLNQGTIEGKATNLTGTTHSLGKPTAEECDSYDDIQTLADNMLANSDPNLTLYQKNFGTKTVSGNKTFGTEGAPEVLYIKTGIFGKVKFTGEIDGHGIMVADGNVDFEDQFTWHGVVINDANAIGNVLDFEDTTNITGAAMVNRPFLTAEVGTVSGDLKFSGGNHTIKYSSAIVDSILGNLDPNYTPPAGATPGQSMSISSIQVIDN